MKRRKIQISEDQQTILGVVLVLLVAISLLYCLGFASLVLRQVWEGGPLPWENKNLNEDSTPSSEEDLDLPEEQIDPTPLSPPVEPTSGATAPP
jgi:hypothetical protein